MRTSARPDQQALRHTIDCFWDTIPPVWNQIRQHLRDVVLADVDLTVEQFHVLRHIRQGTGSVSEIAAAKRISRPAISQAVDVLVHKGLILRRQSTGDRRYVQLELTRAGTGLLNAIFERNRAWMAEKLAPSSAEELESIRRGLAALAKAFEAPEE
jgi:DNA-binding MarR family transcriptional regulator